MALHGDIKVNGQRIAVWEAVRERGVVTEEGLYRYRCSVQEYDTAGDFDILGPVARFTVDHRHEDGALSLAEAVITQGHAMFKERRG